MTFTTQVSPDHVCFPRDRATQSADLMALAGEALLRGDGMAWRTLYMASLALGGMPEYDSEAGRASNAAIRETIREEALRKAGR